MKTFIKLFTLYIFLTIFTISCMMVEDSEFSELDDNNNNRIDIEEFVGYYTYGGHQLKKEKELDVEGFYDYMFEIWDSNDNDKIDRNEWEFGNNYFLNRDYNLGTFNESDLNNDKNLSFEEFQKTVKGSGIFTSWDTDHDNMLNRVEIAQGVFLNWDADNSGYIVESEYKRFRDYFLGNQLN